MNSFKTTEKVGVLDNLNMYSDLEKQRMEKIMERHRGGVGIGMDYVEWIPTLLYLLKHGGNGVIVGMPQERDYALLSSGYVEFSRIEGHPILYVGITMKGLDFLENQFRKWESENAQD